MSSVATRSFEAVPRTWTTIREGSVGGHATRDPLRLLSSSAAGSTAEFLNNLELLVARSAAPDWLDEVYELVASDQRDAAIDALFAGLDDLFLDGQFDECNAVLRQIDVDRLDTFLLVSALSITKAAAGRLPYRERFVACVERRLRELAGARAESLLEGLR